MKIKINTQNSGLPFLHSHLEWLMSSTTASAYWKDTNGIYIGANDNFLGISTLESYDNLIGISDMEIFWKDYAPLMMKNDQVVMKNHISEIFIEPSIDPHGYQINYLSSKTPLCNASGKIIGMIGLSYWLEDSSWDGDKLNEIAMLLGVKAADEVKKFLFKKNLGNYQLTKQQYICLYYMSNGMSMKQIASRMSLSHRTVEHYIEAIKNKFKCFSKSDLIDKLFDLGLMYK